MKLESLKLDKFKNDALEKKQMFSLKGGVADAGTVTPAGRGSGVHPTLGYYEADYGYDSIREGGVVTYHNRTNYTYYGIKPTIA
ncbi:TIGR04149 family rSAM-modified RiPP [Flavobacterium sp.]|uniref:TIGR04149 family rSAM-modified RiPP n=1 Tax=Flavobacterium sp. TaxID=239 RepID=UPI003750F9E4